MSLNGSILIFVIWIFEFVWNLEIVIWDLANAVEVNHALRA